MRLYATDLETREVSGGPAICARPSEKAPSPTRWNTASGSVGGICLRTTLSKDSVWVSHLCALAGGPSALAPGKRGDQPEHDRSSRPHNFLSHELQTRVRNERYRKGQFFGIKFAAFCRFGLVFLDRVGEKPGTGRIGPGGESLAAPRGVSDASRRCKQRPSKFFVGERFSSEITFQHSSRQGQRVCRTVGQIWAVSSGSPGDGSDGESDMLDVCC